MVRPAAKGSSKEDDLSALAAQAGDPGPEAGIPFGTIFLGPEERGIDQAGDPGFKTRVKPPAAKPAAKTTASKTTASKPPAAKTTGTMPRGSAVEKSAADIAETLEEKFALLFGMVTSALPVTGTYGVENSPKAVRALIDIGKRRPAVMRALTKIADGADGMEIGKFVMGIAVAVQVDMQKMNGDELLARSVGVTEVLEKYFVDPNQPTPNDNVTEQVTYARFQPV